MSTVTEQKGYASSTPSFFMRWLQSKIGTYLSSEQRQEKQRKKAEANRQKEGRPHVVEYFHQVDDGYSHLAVQTLAPLLNRYDIALKIHLVPASLDDNIPEPEMLNKLSYVEAAQIAPYYGLCFPDVAAAPTKELCDLACRVLCKQSVSDFVDLGASVSSVFWTGDKHALDKLAEVHGSASAEEFASAMQEGAERRKELGHYSGAMFWYEGEWYWGVDRLYHLEKRLSALGIVKDRSASLVAPRPETKTEFGPGARKLTLEYYPSLRSPYTAVSWDPTMKLAKDSGVKFKIQPVLPMVMRGVPATRQKGMYIAIDAAREAREADVDYGKFYDPIGEPVKRGYSHYMWANAFGKGTDVLGAFLKVAFARGINTNTNAGMKKVAELAGLDWSEARNHLDGTDWEQPLEANRTRMYSFGSWGVPSYHLLDENGKEVLGVWGRIGFGLCRKRSTSWQKKPDL